MKSAIILASGGALGAISRYYLSVAVETMTGGKFPFGTFAVNLLGCFILGILYYLFELNLPDTHWLRTFIIIGFLGSFTTFSSFTLETWSLLQSGDIILASTNIVASVASCLIGLYCGLLLAKQIVN